MLPNKQVFYDARSMNPAVGDTCQVRVQHQDQPLETLTAVYLGSCQLESYTTPYFKFLVGQEVRLICSNSVREWRYTLSTPSMVAPQLTGVGEDDL